MTFGFVDRRSLPLGYLAGASRERPPQAVPDIQDPGLSPTPPCDPVPKALAAHVAPCVGSGA